MIKPVIVVLLQLILFASSGTLFAQRARQKPNIIFILADDLGYGDIEPYGQAKIKTPFLSRLAEEGMLFTQFYAGTSVCAPSRSALMTGQHTGHTYRIGDHHKYCFRHHRRCR